MIEDTLRFDVCSQEAVTSRPEKEIEVLEIDDSNKLMQNCVDASESSQFSNIFGGNG